jgi:hypothetical protein
LRKLLIAICLLGMPCISLAQANRGASWEALNGLHTGQKIEVVEMGLKEHRGTFVAVSDEAIQLLEGATHEPIKKENVMRVTLLDKNHRLTNVVLFAGVGAGVGAVIGVAAAGNRRQINGKGIGAALGAAIGFLGGAGVGAALPTDETIYRARPH